MTRVDVQIIESKNIQIDQGANISICTDQYLLHGYTLISPFNIGHALNKGPPFFISQNYLVVKTA